MYNHTGFVEDSRFEHCFWLQILSDHGRFIYTNLAPKETALINKARQFILLFDSLLARARTPMDEPAYVEFAREVLPAVQALRAFKLDILRRSLCNQVEIAMTPTFFNHMLNELEEYLQNLGYLANGQPVPVKNPVHHNLLWVLDASGHAGAVSCSIDESDTFLRMEAEKYKKLWDKKYIETVEFKGYLRTGMPMFPALGHFDKDVAREMFKFQDYLEGLKIDLMQAKVIGALPALVPDHMAREECYYLHRLSQSDPANVPRPNCDPTRPRIQG